MYNQQSLLLAFSDNITRMPEAPGAFSSNHLRSQTLLCGHTTTYDVFEPPHDH